MVRPESYAEPRLVSTLLGHAHVEMALLCLGSLVRFSAEPLRLRVHDDGTLTSADQERLAAALGEPEVVPRRVADERVEDLLAAHPAARALRRENPLALKLLDLPVFAGEDEAAVRTAGAGEICYCDSDVLFLRPFRGLFDLPEGAGALFMRDPQNAYSVRSWHLLREPRLRLAAHVNSGVFTFRMRCFDPDLVEWFLSRPEHRFAPVWVEQTCWALLARPAGCWLLDPQAVAIPAAGEEAGGGRDRDRVALHFVSPVRGLFARYAGATREPAPKLAGSVTPDAEARTGAAPAVSPVVIRSFPALPLSALGLAAAEARRRLRRLRPVGRATPA
jgi:hypothetical protein